MGHDLEEHFGPEYRPSRLGLVYHLALSRLDPNRPNLVVETGTNLGSTTIVIDQRSGLFWLRY